MPVHPYFPGGNSGSGDGAVTSVNGEQGDVVLTAQNLQAQPQSTVLTDIAAITMPDNSFLMVGPSGDFMPAPCMPAGVAWLGYTTVDQQKAHLAYATIATTGSYSDLTDKPSIPTAQVNSDWIATSGVSQVLNKPSLFSGSYVDLTGKPVLFSGNYADLSGKPVLFDGTYTSLTGKPTSFPPSAHTHAISDVTGLQANLDSKATAASLSGYVTSSTFTTSLSGYATTTALTTALSAKFNIPAGSTTQYLRGDGSLATFPAIPTVPTNVSAFTNDSGYLTSAVLTGYRKVETFLGTSDASGNITITFSNTYATPPDVQPQIIGGTFNQSVRVVSVSNTGCVVQAAQRNVVTLLSIEVLLGATVNLVGASVTVQVTPRS